MYSSNDVNGRAMVGNNKWSERNGRTGQSAEQNRKLDESVCPSADNSGWVASVRYRYHGGRRASRRMKMEYAFKKDTKLSDTCCSKVL